ncbi:MAG TPA: hypothetical protein VNV88_12690 [Candidatus Solibacter sp.]|nr:hypothetical protein [Candidatus Solibacter sp.]
MTELGTLFLVVFAVYVVQCICWVSPDSAVFALKFRGRGKRKGQGFVWSAFDTAAFFANPLPPLSPPLVTHWPAFQLNPDSILFAGPKGETVSIPWEKLIVTHSGSKLLCNGTRVFKGEETQVQGYFDLLQQIRQAKRSQREQIIQKWLRKSVNKESAARHIKIFQRRSLGLKIASNLQFFLLFLLLPLAIGTFVPRILWMAIFVVVATSIVIAVDFWSLHRELLTKAKDARFKATLTIALSPVAAIRARDSICHDLVATYHPVAVAGAICSDAEFEALAGEHLRRSRFGAFSNQWYQKKLQDSMERVIRQRGLEPEQLLVPAVQSSGCILYCPRCFAQYVTERADCADCGYETLAAFKTISAPVSSK